MDAIPFSISGAYEGLARTDGILRFESDELVLEFRTKDSLFGLLRTDVKEIRVPIGELESVEYKAGFFAPSLVIAARNMTVLGPIPGLDSGEVTLKFKRKHRDRLRELAENIRLRLTTHQVARLCDHANKASTQP